MLSYCFFLLFSKFFFYYYMLDFHGPCFTFLLFFFGACLTRNESQFKRLQSFCFSACLASPDLLTTLCLYILYIHCSNSNMAVCYSDHIFRSVWYSLSTLDVAVDAHVICVWKVLALSQTPAVHCGNETVVFIVQQLKTSHA